LLCVLLIWQHTVSTHSGESIALLWRGLMLRPLLLRLVPGLLVHLLVGLTTSQPAEAQPSRVSDAQVISSSLLGYDLQYWVYTPEGYADLEALPVLFLSDGAWYLEYGNMPVVMDSLIAAGRMEPIVAVFLDARIPGHEHLSRRNAQYFCNQSYIGFYREELIPAIDWDYKTRSDRMARTIAGLSFGGLNAACFGLYAHDSFQGIAMQSLATHPVRYIHQAYADSTRLPLRIFLSSGDHNDNEARTRAFRDILMAKEYPLEYIEVPFAHFWENWGPLLDDLLLHFYGLGHAD
jgi:enterochelin esterase-like enzyme